MVKVIFCLPGMSYGREFITAWTDLVMRVASDGHEVALAQNTSPDACLGGRSPFDQKMPYDVIMWIGSNILFKYDDFVELLNSPHGVTAGYYVEDERTGFVSYMTDSPVKFDEITESSEKYQKVSYSGMGWMMVKSGVFEKLEYPWFSGGPTPDISFSNSLAKAGVDIHVDTKLRVGHQKLVII